MRILHRDDKLAVIINKLSDKRKNDRLFIQVAQRITILP